MCRLRLLLDPIVFRYNIKARSSGGDRLYSSPKFLIELEQDYLSSLSKLPEDLDVSSASRDAKARFTTSPPDRCKDLRDEVSDDDTTMLTIPAPGRHRESSRETVDSQPLM